MLELVDSKKCTMLYFASQNKCEILQAKKRMFWLKYEGYYPTDEFISIVICHMLIPHYRTCQRRAYVLLRTCFWALFFCSLLAGCHEMGSFTPPLLWWFCLETVEHKLKLRNSEVKYIFPPLYWVCQGFCFNKWKLNNKWTYSHSKMLEIPPWSK